MALKKITFAGHSATFISGDGCEIAVDPWLEGNPLCPLSLKSPKALDLIILTHGHADHAGDAVRLAKQYGAVVAATYELAMLLIKEGLPDRQALPMNKGGTVELKGIFISLTQALHSSSYDTAHGTVYAGEPCGVVLRDGRNSVYHAGDTALFSDMKLIGEFYKPRVALLPIGDRFTMGPKEAARAAQFVGCKVAIPLHYNTFDMLTGTAEEFIKECKSYDIDVAVIDPGNSFSI